MSQNTIALLHKNNLLIEVALVILVIVSVVMQVSGVEGADSALMVTMFSLAAYYFLGAYFPPEEAGLFTIVAIKVISIASAVCMIGISFTFMKFTGADQMLMIGISALVPAGVVLVATGFQVWKNSYLFLLFRIVILLAIATTILLRLLHEG